MSGIAAPKSKSQTVQRPRKKQSQIELLSNQVVKEQHVGRFSSLSSEKLRGGYYTPQHIADWLCKWAIRQNNDTFLEPSCGDGTILLSATSRLAALGCNPTDLSGSAVGVELMPQEASQARARLAASGLVSAPYSCVEAGDFFAWKRANAERRFTAVVGNPPFIRYQSFPEPSRTRAMDFMQACGLRPNKLTNIWVPFVVAATESLEAGGRLALVVPAELLQVTYAAQLRSYLTERFEHIGIVACNELFFEGAEQEVLLLLAEGALSHRISGNKCRVALMQAASVANVLAAEPSAALAALEEKDVKGDSEKWLKYFLTSREISFMRSLRKHKLIVELSHFARVDVGVVTGKNEFFVVRKSEITEHKLNNLTRRLVSRAAHLRGTIVTSDDWVSLADRDERVHLVDIRQEPEQTLSAAAKKYVASGEAKGFHLGYKCSIRKPWFHVPALWMPDGFLFRQIHDFPRFVCNKAGATSTDTIHRFTARGCDPEALIASTFTHLTAASAEIEGRSYGGGVLELEPTEAEKLLVPNVLDEALPLEEADKLLRSGKLGKLLEENDKRVLRGALGLSKSDCTMLKDVWVKMRDRRMARNRKATRKSD